MDPVNDAPSRTQRRRQATRDRIVTAALELLPQHGYEATSMEMVAEQADVARTTVFNHFPRKDALLLAALADRRRVVADRLHRTAAQGLRTRDRIRDAVRHWARAYQSDQDTGAALVRAWVQAAGPYLPDAAATAHLFADTLAAGQRDGDIRAGVDTTAAGLALFDALIGTLVRWAGAHQAGPRRTLTTAMLRTADTVLDGLLAGATTG
jgi:AcrR family transcriptional regulator